MTFRDKLALNVAPMCIRLALALVFVWAGAGKLFHTDTVTGENAAALANLGVIEPPAPPAGTPSPSSPAPAPAGSAGESAAAASSATPASTPTDTPDANGGVTFTLPAATAPAAKTPLLYSAAQFPGNTTVSRRHTSITLKLFHAAQPDAQGRQLWPSALASPGVLRTIAWIAPLAEFAGGFLVLVGFLTRLSAFSLVGTMLGAMLLTTVGPAALSSDPFMGFLPQPNLADSAAWVASWTPMLFQFTLLMAALALTLSGPGALSLDRLVFGGRGHSGDGDDGADDEDEDDD